MIKLYDLNVETRGLLDGFSGHQVELILDYASDLMVAFDGCRGRPRMGANGCVELMCALLVWMQTFHEQQSVRKGNCNERRNNGDHDHGETVKRS